MKQRLRRLGSFLLRSDLLLLVLCMITAAFGLIILYSATRTYETERYMVVQIGAAAIVPHRALADSLMEEISRFVEENTEAEILDERREIR